MEENDFMKEYTAGILSRILDFGLKIFFLFSFLVSLNFLTMQFLLSTWIFFLQFLFFYFYCFGKAYFLLLETECSM